MSFLYAALTFIITIVFLKELCQFYFTQKQEYKTSVNSTAKLLNYNPKLKIRPITLGITTLPDVALTAGVADTAAPALYLMFSVNDAPLSVRIKNNPASVPKYNLPVVCLKVMPYLTAPPAVKL